MQTPWEEAFLLESPWGKDFISRCQEWTPYSLVKGTICFETQNIPLGSLKEYEHEIEME